MEAVLAREPRTAVFDCDGTLWMPDSGAGFMVWSLEQGLIRQERAERLKERYRLYEAGKVSELAICGEMVQVYAGLSVAELRAAARTYVERFVLPATFPIMEELIGKLRETGAQLWAVSSTCDWVVEAGVVKRFGIPLERILAAKVRVEQGLATETLLTVPTDEGKQAALENVGVWAPDAVFGNSLHDLHMLRMARHPYPVNPSAALWQEAKALGWRMLRPTLQDAVES